MTRLNHFFCICQTLQFINHCMTNSKQMFYSSIFIVKQGDLHFLFRLQVNPYLKKNGTKVLRENVKIRHSVLLSTCRYLVKEICKQVNIFRTFRICWRSSLLKRLKKIYKISNFTCRNRLSSFNLGH